jgi:hypothetical protein
LIAQVSSGKSKGDKIRLSPWVIGVLVFVVIGSGPPRRYNPQHPAPTTRYNNPPQQPATTRGHRCSRDARQPAAVPSDSRAAIARPAGWESAFRPRPTLRWCPSVGRSVVAVSAFVLVCVYGLLLLRVSLLDMQQ